MVVELLLGLVLPEGRADEEEDVPPPIGARSLKPGSSTPPTRAFGGASGLGPAPALTGAGGDEGTAEEVGFESDGTELLVDGSDESVVMLEPLVIGLLLPEPQFVQGAVVTGVP